jgi:hypothetical protein
MTEPRKHLEEQWRLKLEEASSRYKAATRRYRSLLEKQNGAAGLEAVFRARTEETQARAEYTRVLKIFTDLTIHGMPPGEAAAANAADP